MKLKTGRYENYRDSEIDGLVEIPSHWRLERLKSISEIRSGVAKGRNLSGKQTIELPYLRVANVQENRLELEDISKIEIQLSEEARYSLKPGDVLMTEGGDNDKLGRGAVWDGQIPRCLHQNHIFAVRPFDSENSYWINWMTQTEFLKYFFLSRSKQTTNLASISSTNLKVIPIVFPPLHERSAIAHYLDTKTTQIDRKIDLLTQKVQRYEELKRSLINETVTRGLDKSVPMKDSAIEWIGEIPEHWDVQRLKDLADIQNSNVDKKTHPNESVIKLCNYVDVYKNDFIDSSLDFMEATATKEEIRKFRIEKGDVFITKDSETCEDIAIPALACESFDNVICGYHLARIRVKRKIFLGAYLFRLFQSEKYGFRFMVSAKGITRVGLGQSSISDALTPTPPLDEQKAIAEYLDTRTAQIQQVVQTINTQIETLKELRKTLINDVVTGKIKVTDS